jgi:broad specificity phosphatase PhoE
MKRWIALNEIHAGICEGITYADVKEKYPYIMELRKQDKYAFRYPEGESYQDLVHRVERVILALERLDQPVLVVAHQAVLRALFAYFDEDSAEEAVNWDVPHRHVWKYLTWGHGASRLERIPLPEPSANACNIHIEGEQNTDFPPQSSQKAEAVTAGCAPPAPAAPAEV